MSHDPIERWEWEGGALAVDTSVREEVEPDDLTWPPAERGDHAETAHQQASGKG